MKTNILLSLLPILLLLTQGCATTSLQGFMTGFEKKEYIEPTGNGTATLTIEAPRLKKMLGLHDNIDVFIYDSCVDKSSQRLPGYVGGFRLSSNTAIGNKKTINIPAGQPVFLEVGYDHYNGAECTNKFHINAEENARYSIQWQMVSNKCSAVGTKFLDEEYQEKSEEIIQKANSSSFLGGGSGSTSSEWRLCKNL